MALSEEARKSALDKKIWELSGSGWTVVNRSGFYATLKKGKRPNHILHLLLSLITFGFWIPVWVIVALTVREQTLNLFVEEDGTI